jgi:hypothetical protein
MSLLTDKIKISINNQQRTTVRSVSTSALTTVTQLSQLLDVNASDPDNNEVLVYDATTQNYIIKTLPAIDGGSY